MITKLHYLDGRIITREDIAENVNVFKMVDPSETLKGLINKFDYLDDNGLKKTLLHIRVFEYFELFDSKMVIDIRPRHFVEVDPLNNWAWEYDEAAMYLFPIKKEE